MGSIEGTHGQVPPSQISDLNYVLQTLHHLPVEVNVRCIYCNHLQYDTVQHVRKRQGFNGPLGLHLGLGNQISLMTSCCFHLGLAFFYAYLLFVLFDT